ncbi:MAG: GIY-YIG nuclease family protein [Proteobacteria bacterium]|nr:GIY-YIG nuclease family protein [Pseudomonadota bacterium]MBU1737901.1 GIY-YIG nuclease family protein [Pseudomonadota bacterium]
MIDFEKELHTILQDDPLGLLAVKAKASSAISGDERLVASFEEINSFIREHGHEPAESRDINERRLYSRLKGIRNNPQTAEPLTDYDIFGLLGEPEKVEPVELNTVEDVLEHDTLGLLDGGASGGEADPGDIFTLTHVSKPADRPDYVAKRKKCKEFARFEPLFRAIHTGLKTKVKVTRKFTSERQIKPGEFFILDGMLVLVANQGEWEKKNFGNVNARLYCVFENGTESNMYLRSLAAALWKDEHSRQVIDAKQKELFKEDEQVAGEDEATGYIYVLRSLSEAPEIREIENLYKIGFSRKPIADRIQNAAQEPTYLMADVVPVVDWQTYNLNPQKLEQLLHTFFAEACIELDVFDGDGKRHTPREWFDVPLHIIETVVELLINGEIVNYRYHHARQEIMAK